MDDSMNLEVEVRRVVEATIEKDISSISLDENILKKLGLDSMTALEIMAAIEHRFKIRIQEQDLPKITSLKSVIEVLTQYLNKKDAKS